MIADLRPYPAYKDSGVPWLGEIPAHWDTKPLKRWVRINAEVLPETTAPDYEFRYLDIGSVVTGSLAQKPQRLRFRDAPSRARRVVRMGDTIISTVRTYLKAVYFIGEEADGLICSTGFAVLTPSVGTVPKFVRYLAQSNSFTDRVTADSIGIAYPAIAETRLGSFHVVVPQFLEQHAIVRYLDHVDRRIRRYIRAKQQLIKLLEEQKQAIIHSAVTGQVDVRTGQPYPAYKPSGVEWLGEVPAHWGVRRSKRLFLPRTELARPADIQLSATQAYGVISQEEYERRVGRKIVKIFRHLEKRRHVEIDDFVISMRSFQGGLERAWERGCIRSSYVVLKPSQSLCVPYFAQLFKSSGYIGALQATANFIRDGQDLNFSNFCAVDLPWPPLDEQEQIAAALDSALVALVKAAQRSEREITLLREYRTRLIADVVTGKLDVRAAAAALPAESDEPELFDDAGALAEDGEDITDDDTDVAPEETDA